MKHLNHTNPSSARHNTVCVCHRDRQIRRVVNRRAGRLVICLSAFSLSKLHCVLASLNKGGSLLLSESVCVYERERALSEHVEGVTCSLPCFPNPSAHLVVAMGTARWRQTLQQPPEGIVRTETRFKGEESLWGFREKLQTFGF